MSDTVLWRMLVCIWCVVCVYSVINDPNDLQTMTILTSVHAPWNNCIATVPSPPLQPNITWRKAKHIDVGGCDSGPITVNIFKKNNPNSNCKMMVGVTLYSENLAAMPPTCEICWNGTYLTPQTFFANESLLPGCETSDSVEGYHMTYYWFHVLSWT